MLADLLYQRDGDDLAAAGTLVDVKQGTRPDRRQLADLGHIAAAFFAGRRCGVFGALHTGGQHAMANAWGICRETTGSAKGTFPHLLFQNLDGIPNTALYPASI
jgi:hypothetical protein